MKPPLTTESLQGEFASWPNSNRNSHDLRFGQHIINNYSHVSGEVFYIEDRFACLKILAEELKDYQR